MSISSSQFGNGPQPRFNVLLPRLPIVENLLPYLRKIDHNRWYSNNGPLLQSFEQRLAENFHLPVGSVIAVSSGTSAITLALRSSGIQPGSRCLMPSLTFVATAAAVLAAGLIPHFVDIDPQTWQPDPAVIVERHDLATVGAIVVVSPFGGLVDCVAWERVTAVTGIPVVIDGAAAFDAFATSSPTSIGDLPIAISLHATKPLGVGEGGLVLARNCEHQDCIRRLANFGFFGFPEATDLGWNAKMSEYHAAVGLAALDGWDSRRKALAALMSVYKDKLGSYLPLVPGFGSSWVSSTACVLLPSEAELMARALSAHGIETRRWWRSGIHAMPAYAHLSADPLPVTTAITRSLLGLPFHVELDAGAVIEICDTLRFELARI